MYADFEQIRSNVSKKMYKYIGSGSGRAVFDLGNGYVVKVAKNRRGIAQNKAETQIASANYSNLFARIAQSSDDYEFVIMERAEKIQRISEVWEYFHVRNERNFYQLPELQEISQKYSLILKDLRRPENWGKVNGRPVIVDYGFTRRVMKKYYSFF